ncbi:type VI secretion system baseplate subunit TssF [Marisediminicola senii]|uniref:type VI secretion system baseplate subunit TssF n=1 Tax=Marisediminicola senii TaxID=2711233 RepID=UPI0013E9AB63|nr:type VI secretion system baseplate subunit TssF [Marisediminicola senii]
MTSRLLMLPLSAMLVLAFAGCTPGGDGYTDDDREPATATGGALELAVSEICTDQSELECVSVGGQRIVAPASFQRAGVAEATAARGDGASAVEVTFDKNGTAVFAALTSQAAGAGDAARLVIGVGGDIHSAVSVLEALDTSEVRIVLGPGEDPDDLVDLIREG